MRTPRINLLPYREERKKAIKNRYLAFLGGSFVVGALAVLAVHSYFSLQTTTQEARNTMLDQDITKLDKQIEEIKRLRQEIAAAVARKQVVESLQANRSRAVMILNQIVQPPANIFYRSAKQSGDSLTLNGLAPSNTSVSALIKQIESSDILFDPKLVESKAVVVNGTPLIEFTMNAHVIDLAKVASDKAKATKKPDAPIVASPAPAAPVAVVADPNVIKQPATLAPAVAPAATAAPAAAATVAPPATTGPAPATAPAKN